MRFLKFDFLENLILQLVDGTSLCDTPRAEQSREEKRRHERGEQSRDETRREKAEQSRTEQKERRGEERKGEERRMGRVEGGEKKSENETLIKTSNIAQVL